MVKLICKNNLLTLMIHLVLKKHIKKRKDICKNNFLNFSLVMKIKKKTKYDKFVKNLCTSKLFSHYKESEQLKPI